MFSPRIIVKMLEARTTTVEDTGNQKLDDTIIDDTESPEYEFETTLQYYPRTSAPPSSSQGVHREIYQQNFLTWARIV